MLAVWTDPNMPGDQHETVTTSASLAATLDCIAGRATELGWPLAVQVFAARFPRPRNWY